MDKKSIPELDFLNKVEDTPSAARLQMLKNFAIFNNNTINDLNIPVLTIKKRYQHLVKALILPRNKLCISLPLNFFQVKLSLRYVLKSENATPFRFERSIRL